MGSLAPEHYRITNIEIDKYIDDIDCYLSTNYAIFFKDDLYKYIADGNQLIGKISLCKRALKENSNRLEDWEKRERDVNIRIQEAKARYEKIFLC